MEFSGVRIGIVDVGARAYGDERGFGFLCS